jgi:hypothetical protein
VTTARASLRWQSSRGSTGLSWTLYKLDQQASDRYGHYYSCAQIMSLMADTWRLPGRYPDSTFVTLPTYFCMSVFEADMQKVRWLRTSYIRPIGRNVQSRAQQLRLFQTTPQPSVGCQGARHPGKFSPRPSHLPGKTCKGKGHSHFKTGDILVDGPHAQEQPNLIPSDQFRAS